MDNEKQRDNCLKEV